MCVKPEKKPFCRIVTLFFASPTIARSFLITPNANRTSFVCLLRIYTYMLTAKLSTKPQGAQRMRAYICAMTFRSQRAAQRRMNLICIVPEKCQYALVFDAVFIVLLSVSMCDKIIYIYMICEWKRAQRCCLCARLATWGIVFA